MKYITYMTDAEEILKILEHHIRMYGIQHDATLVVTDPIPTQPVFNMAGGKLQLLDTVIDFGGGQMWFDPKDKKLKLDVDGKVRVIG